MDKLSKTEFFEKYKDCALEYTLELIWKARETKATKLNISGIGMGDLSPLKELVNLQKLFMFDNFQIYDLSPLKDLVNLQIFGVNSRHVDDLSPFKDLMNLEELNINSTFVSNLTPLKDLVNLKRLDIGKTFVENLSPLKGLVNLEVLIVSSTHVSNLSPLENLVNLQELDIRVTAVEDLSPLKNLKNLQLLHLSMYVGDLSPLKGLSNLKLLSICSTGFIDLNPLKDLSNLQQVDISDSQISDLSPLKNLIKKGIEVKWIRNDGNNGIFVYNTPLTNPPIEIAKQGNATILRYWREQERVGTITLNEARLLIVGQGGAGKTTLRTKLMDAQATLPEPDATTRGIEVELLNFKNTEGGDFTLHIWDFGGQNIQHYAHQFFLSDSVVYALVHSEREQNDHSSYWLSIMELLGKTSPILLVQNEKFGHSADLKDLPAIRERFAHVGKYFKVDLSKAKNPDYQPFRDLQAEIRHLAAHLPHIGKTYLRSFNAVRYLLKALAAVKNHISWDDFEYLCTQQGIEDRELMRDYARQFHQLGIALWFEHDLDLENLVFLNPKWIIDALFELLYDGEALRTQHTLRLNDTKSIWRGDAYRGIHGNLLRLMKNFEMCYDIGSDTPQYIIPQLLPADRAEHQSTAEATKVVFQYKFLPKGFLTRLTCRLHTRIADQKVWNDAVVFEDRLGATVFAKETYAQNAIELIAEGKGKRQLLNEVINTLNDINAGTKFGNLQVQTLIACSCKSCRKAEQTKEFADLYQFDYQYLRKKLLKGDPSVECQKSLDMVLIKDILREVNAFSFKEIREKIGSSQLKEVVNLLRGRYPENKEVIGLQSQVSHLSLDDIHGVLFRNDKNVELNEITQRLLNLIDILEKD